MTIKLTNAVFILALLISISGCQSLPKRGTSIPAKITVHSQESLVELRQAVKKLLYNHDVLVAASAFTQSDRLIIQRRPIKGPGGRIIDTQVDEEPMIFQLYLLDNECYVERVKLQERVRLTRATCIAL